MPNPIARLNAALEGRYRVERQLGEGGMAIVYLADDLRHERRVALKVLKPELAAVVGAERFLAEIKTTANLQHPHILPLFDSGAAGAFLFYVMPFVEGETLRDRLDREHQLPVDEAVQIAKNVAEALEFAHSRGVVHRDIKPANILLQAGKPVLSDFGIALAVGPVAGGRLTETGLSLGTPHYMSPEQATGDLSVGAGTDIYALGCVLYEILVGEPPYTGSTAQAILGKIVTGAADPVRKHRKSVPLHVDAATRKALEKVPADRFAGAHDFATALADSTFRHDEPSGAVGASRRTLWNPLSVVTTSLAVLVLSLWAVSRLGQEAGPIVSRFEVPLPEGLQVGTGTYVGFDVSPDGANLAFVGSTPGEPTRIWLRPRDRLDVSPISGTEGGRNPRFSPDGASLAFTAGGSLKTISISGGAPRTLIEASALTAGGVAWGDDQMLYFAKSGSGIWRIPANGGEEEQLTTLADGESNHAWPELLPDGAGLLFSRFGPDADPMIAVLSIRDGEARRLFTGTMARYAESGHVIWTSLEGTLFGAVFDVDRLNSTATGVALLEGVELGRGGNGYFALSERGDLLYRPAGFRRGGTPVWVGRDGSERPVDPGLTVLFRDPAVSPDGRRIAYEAGSELGREIRVYDVDQRTLTSVTFGGDSRRPFWSIDGNEVGFFSRTDGGQGWYSQPADLSGPARLLVRTEGIGTAWWTPDGRGLAYSDGGELMYSVAHPDSVPRAVANTPFNEGAPALSRDGRWLAYQSNESGQTEIYVRPFQREGGRVLVSRDGGWTPVWSHRGDELFYVRPGDLSMMVATVQTDSVFSVESNEPLIPWTRFWATAGGRHFDIAPDGQSLLALRINTSAGSPDVLVVNYFEELKRLVPN